jgi:hypothetical protein
MSAVSNGALEVSALLTEMVASQDYIYMEAYYSAAGCGIGAAGTTSLYICSLSLHRVS